MKIGMVGLGRMGMNMTRRLLKAGHEVVVYNRSPEKVKTAEAEGAIGASSLKELCEKLSQPAAVWVMVPAGAATDGVIDELKGYLAEPNVVERTQGTQNAVGRLSTIIDGGNTHYKDDLRRAGDLKESGINYIDAGTSGGIWGLQIGYCLMVGGDKDVCKSLEPIFLSLAPEGGYLYCGLTGAGHYVKMVHNGIEYGLMEAYAEGFELLNASPYGKDLEFSKVAHLWNNGSVVRSWLLELMEDAFTENEDLSGIAPYVSDSGEGRWTVQEAVDLGVPLPVITESLFRRFRSRDDDSFAEKALSAMRNQFGGHAIKTPEKK